MALGASRPAILWMVLRNGLAQVSIGLLIGITISLAAARPMSFLMSGIGTTDPCTMAITAGMLLLKAASPVLVLLENTRPRALPGQSYFASSLADY